MDETVYKVALAGFLHDIGKFAERAEMKVSPDFLNSNAGLYQPYSAKQQRHTHKHAVYTAAFIDHIEKLLPEKFNKAVWGLGDTFINLSAGHHNPQTPLQWVIAMADRVSSGFDRQEFENYNNETDNKGIAFRDYKKTRLLTLFEGLSVNDKWKDDKLESYVYRYPLKELSPQNIFPVKWNDVAQADKEAATKEYYELFLGFVDALERLEHKQNIPLWFEHFDSLFLIYASHIPAASVGTVVPDVSLYDHSKITAAMAASIYKYHQECGSLDVDHIKNYDDKIFLLINGDLYGIQDFIFTVGGSTGRASAKLLRGRSFSASLIAELAADMVCREFSVPASSIVLNAAGKFTIIAPNTHTARTKVQEIEKTINKWLIENFYGESSLGISTIEATCNDFVSGNFPRLWEKLQSATDRKKFSKEYLDSFNNTLEHPLCPFCGKRPSHENAFVNLSRNEDECACKVCRDHIYIGEHLVKEERIAITTPDADLKGEKLFEPIFGKYQLSFDVSGKLGGLARTEILGHWYEKRRKNLKRNNCKVHQRICPPI
jgi:CRISPR-associated protein Csm1